MKGNHWVRVIACGAVALLGFLAAGCAPVDTSTPEVVQIDVPQIIEVTRVVEIAVPEVTISTALVEREPAYPVELLDGDWKEYWAVGEQSDVTYNDIFQLAVERGQVTIDCLDRPTYVFENIQFTGSNLMFTKINGDYIVNYNLHFDEISLTDVEPVLVGSITTNQGLTARVIWAKLGD